jgi:late competence protein required for DNA uptake (superfamily II DNA/RNA helicase)
MWVGMLNIVKVSIFPKLINMLNAMSIKIPARFLADKNIIPKFLWKGKETRIVAIILEKKNKVEKLSPSIFSYINQEWVEG